MKHLSLKCYFLLPALAAASFSKAQKKEVQPPNLVFIMADQWRGDAIGCLGREPVLTPHLDRLAADGVIFSNSVSSYPVSSPARAMLMTGMYPMNNRVTGNCNSQTAPYGVELPQDARCWSDVLKDLAYQTAYIGKWHLDAPRKPYVDTHNNRGAVAWNEWCPAERRHGFDYWEAYGTYDNHLRPMYWSTGDTRENFHYVDLWGPEYEAGKAIEYIDRHKNTGQPFALVVSMNPPHTGYELVPDSYKALYKDLDVEALCANRPDIPPKGSKMGDYYRNCIRNYYACMSGVDENVGRIVDALKRQGLFENTIVVFTSDHGVNMGIHEKDGKNNFYEASMRIPLIISWPARIRPRTDKKTMIAFADLYPTLLSLMGFKKAIPAEVQTFDWSEALLKGKEVKNVIQPYYRVEPENPSSGYRGLRTNRYTFVVEATNGKITRTILFDRKTDPLQMIDIATENPEWIKKYTARLKKWLLKTGDPFAAYL